jgi:hypothetical protein
MFLNVSLRDTPLRLAVKKKNEKRLDPRVVNWKYHINIVK